MNNIDFLKQVLTSTDEYWIVAKRNNYRDFGRWCEGKDSILLICTPNIKLGLAYEEITLQALEELQRAELSNIFINENYPPFQQGQTLYNVYAGYAIKVNVYDFLRKALELRSDSIYEYKQLAEPSELVNKTTAI